MYITCQNAGSQGTEEKKEQSDSNTEDVDSPVTNPENDDSSEDLSSDEENKSTEESPAKKPIIIISCPPSRHGDSK